MPVSNPQPADFPRRAACALPHLQDTIGLDDWAVGRVQGQEWVPLSALGDANVPGTRSGWRGTLWHPVETYQAE